MNRNLPDSGRTGKFGPRQSNVIAFPTPALRREPINGDAEWRAAVKSLTYAMNMAQHARGELPAVVVSALLLGAGAMP